MNTLESLMQDVRYAFRTLSRAPGFAAIAIGTLALAIGANTAIFSVVYAIVLKPLPYPNPEQLVSVFNNKLQEGVKVTGVSYVDLTEYRAENRVFSEIAGANGHALTLTGHGDPQDIPVEVVTPQMFSLLSAKPLLGRTFYPDDNAKGAAPVVILSENFWRSQFGGDARVLGSSIVLDKRPFTVVGVMPADFRTPIFLEGGRDIWIPLVQDPLFGPWMERRGGHWMGVVGRMKPGVTLAQAQAEMDTISARIAKEWPTTNTGWTIGLMSMQQRDVGDVKTALLVLLGAVGLVLLIACANIANLLLTRATARAREMGIRIALGAERTRIARQLLTESAVLGIAGGVIGVCLAYAGVRGLAASLPASLPRVNEIRVDGLVLGFGLVISLGASLIFGLAPALFSAGSDTQTALKEGSGQAGQAGGWLRARNLLAVAEIALAMVLLTAAGLLLRSFERLTSVYPGFDAEHTMKAEVSLPQFQYSTPEQWTAFSSALLAKIQSEPGLQNSAVAVPLPLANGFVNIAFAIEGNPPLAPGITRTADFGTVSPEYFNVMRIPLLRGRDFTSADVMGAPRVAIISERLAQLYFPNQDPIGKRMNFGFPPGTDAMREIVGIVGDVRDQSLNDDPGPMMYVPYAQSPIWGGEIITRTNLSGASVASTIRGDVRAIDKDLPVTDVEWMTEAISSSVEEPRFRTWLIGLFGAVALILAAAGIFGVISYAVTNRTHEIGIRIALGATPGHVMSLILGESARLLLIGLAFGIAVALALGRYLATLLFGVRPTDFVTFAGVAFVLAMVALAAAYIPTRRAMRVDPMVALRYE
jgi:putative ABC transport system permease protein